VDTISTNGILGSSVVEDASVSDQNPASVDFQSAISEDGLLRDQTSASVDWAVQIQESLDAADAFVGLLLWNTINTSQPGVWGHINTSQGTTWNTINTAQAGAWNTIQNAQLTITVDNGGAFAEGAFGSGPFVGIGSEVTITVETSNWDTINTDQTTNWEVIKTQT
jgi:hypothetical protein